MCTICAGTASPPSTSDQLVDQQAAEGALVDEAQLRPPSAKRIRTCRCRSSGASAGRTRNCPLMPRWATSASPAWRPSVADQQRQPQVLAAAAGRHERRAGQPRGEGRAAPARWRRTARGWLTSTAAMRRPTAQRAARRGRSRPREVRARAGQLARVSLAMIARHAVSAAACSASFLLRPVEAAKSLAGHARRGR